MANIGVKNLKQLLAWKPPRVAPIISESILLPETRLLVYGQPKAWKSMLALYTAFQLAEGQDWLGFKTSKVATLKYQVELPEALDRERVVRFVKNSGYQPSNLFFKTPERQTKIDTTLGKTELKACIEDVKARAPGMHVVVILDPLYRLISGHMVDLYDVSKFQDNINDLMSEQHCSFILIHHTRLTRVDSAGDVVDLGSEETYGAAAWNWWVDGQIRVHLLNPNGARDLTKLKFELPRNQERLVPDLKIQWSRETLQPTIVGKEQVSTDEPTIRKLH